uniref:Uncharacterized protein n=1 Tax=Kryptolebias marmoratus TaxID=37003 RepID=A0A3Q3B576_KRYMA
MEVASERSQVVVDEESQTLQRYDRPEESLKTITPHHISVDYKEPLKDLIPERVRTKHQTEKTPEQLKEDGQQSQSEPEAPRAPETKIRDQQSEKSKMLEGQKVDKDSKTLQQEVQSKTETVKDEYGQISSFSPETEQEQYERDQTEVKTSGYTTHTSTSTSRKQEPDHIQPILQDSDHIRPILQDSDHIRPILQDSDHIRPILQDSDHIRPILQESDHIRPTIQDSDHIQPILQESDHIRPILLQESDHIRSLLPQEQKAIKPEDQRIEAASEGLFFQEASRGTEGESVTEHMFLI